ncbi:queuosine precursor transporter [Desulfonauticus submarinus]|uniref:Probable queuosine precursor transporter n=1 Tax=Desulfonauticus submarinus TaxID=206665 RepID=A0A1G9ZFV7_9BACT|nr:queuosine precursor transporter [Desulfonauticus submarinus]SDN20312.1 hypothetical protein SAMN04488516_10114 [Desulfonauticus submarinus]
MRIQHLTEKDIKILITLISLNTALLVASNAAGAKMISVFGNLAASATVFSYAFSFVFTDIISEIYGKQKASFAVKIGFLGLLISVIFFTISIAAPPASFWKNQKAYETTLQLGPRMLAGGWTSYMVSQHLDVWIFHKLKHLTNGKHLWLRNNGSTLISQFIDTCIFITISFYGVFPIIPAIAGQYLIKVIIALLDTPIVYCAVYYIKRYIQTK